VFGSNFSTNFGLPEQPQQQPFPLQATDQQGGLFGPNSPPVLAGNTESDASGNVAPQASPATPLAGPGVSSQSALAPPSPLASGSPQPGTIPQTPQTPQSSPAAPAAGIGSPFARS
jgi:hypothetical protein